MPVDMSFGDITLATRSNRHHVVGGETGGQIKALIVENHRSNKLFGRPFDPPDQITGTGVKADDAFAAGHDGLHFPVDFP